MIELMIVIVIMAIMAGFMALSVRGHVDRAKWTQSFEQLEHIDRMARIAARSEVTPFQLTFSRSKRKVELRSIGPNASKKTFREWKLPRGIQFAAFRDGSSSSRSDAFRIEFNASGQSPTYAVALQASSGPPQWLVTLGFSGQLLRMEKADDVAAMFPK